MLLKLCKENLHFNGSAVSNHIPAYNTCISLALFPEMNQSKGALQNTKLTKKTLHKKFRLTHCRTSEQSKEITGFKSVNVKFK